MNRISLYTKIRNILDRYFNNVLKTRLVLFLLSTILCSASYSQQVSKVLISGLSGNTSHEMDVKNAFLIGYKSYDGTDYTGQIDLHVDNDVYSAIDYAHQNGYQIVVRSYTGLINAVNDSVEKYPDVLLFMPAGSNSFLYYCCLDIPNAAVVSTGAGTDNLATAYKVEFFSIDPITNSNESSFSNGFIAGQISYLANKLNISPQQARLVARNNSSSNQSITYVQYGKIDLGQAVQSNDSTISLPVELTSFTGAAFNDYVTLNWTTSTEINCYGFAIERTASLNLSKGETSGKTFWETVGFVQGYGNSNSQKSYSFVDNLSNLAILKSCNFQYRLKQIDNDGSFKYSNTVQSKINKPSSFELKQNYPNPFNPATTISYQLSVFSHVTLKIYDILGNKITTLVNQEKPAGTYEVTWNAAGQPSGVYFYQLRAGNFTDTKKLILLK